ncbi:DUF3800 domain-containing protein [Methylobacterium indicum]|uniref:DUF3800 domain-containing protein n=1 Tax=Methylobacterium indicum TaxID=1775910 RepID=UPI0009E699D6|nr:DUF3800 domain-containing protein [Methylobacterium indicum]
MHLIYVDESGNTGSKRDPSQPVHMIAALIVEEAIIRPLEDAVDQIMFKHFAILKYAPGFELHAADLFSGNGYFKGIAPAIRIAAINDIFDTLQAHGAEVITSAVDKMRNPSSKHPHHLAFLFLVERIEDHLKRKNALGLIVADENKDVEEKLIEELQQYKKQSTGWGYRPTQINQIVDSVHFVQSKHNKLIQCVDLVAYFALKNYRQGSDRLHQYAALPDPKPNYLTWWSAMSVKQKTIYDLGEKIASITKATKFYP